MVTMVEKSDWPSIMTRRFGFFPCSHHMDDWRKTKVLYACYDNKDALDGHSEKYCNCLKDCSPGSAYFKLEEFSGHCKYFSVQKNCPLHFGMYSFLRKLYVLKWPKDVNKIIHFKNIIAK